MCVVFLVSRFTRALRVALFLFPALAMAVENAELQGKAIETMASQNARSDERNFRTAFRGNIQFVLPPGAQGRVEKTQVLQSGSTGLYVKILTSPHQGEHVWVYWDVKPERRTLKLLDERGKVTEEPARATVAIAKRKTPVTRVIEVQPPKVIPEGASDLAPEIKTVLNTRAPTAQPAGEKSGESRAPVSVGLQPTVSPAVVRPVHTRVPAQLSPAAKVFLAPTSTSQSDDPEIQALAGKIVKDAGAENDPVKITKAIHNWVAAHIPYDAVAYELYKQNPANLNNYPTDAKTVLARSRQTPPAGTICDGYAKLVTALSRAAGVPAVSVWGVVKYPEDGKQPLSCSASKRRDHEWNLVWIDGKWSPEDVTWDSKSYFVGGPAGNAGVIHTYDLDKPSWREANPDHLQCDQNPPSLAPQLFADTVQPMQAGDVAD